MKKTIKIYVKTIGQGKKSFNVASTKLGDGTYASVKFTRSSGFDLNKLVGGYYDISFDSANANLTDRQYTNKKGELRSEKVIWIKDTDVAHQRHTFTEAENQKYEEAFNILIEELPF